MEAVLELFRRGGPIMWPLLACSLVSLTLTIERAVFWWRRGGTRDRKTLDRLLELTEGGEYDAAAALGEGHMDAAPRVLAAGLRHRRHGLEEAMQVAATDEVERMKQGLSVLDTIVTMAPLLGILGTVIGIIESFDLLGASGIEDPKAVTGGIAQALITTAAGLSVALVTLVPFNWFTARVARAARELEQVATQFEVTYRRSIDGSPGGLGE
jgi:biopolymer transport protein ExbB